MFLVSDTSVLIDLERDGFLEVVFSLPYVFAVPDVLYYREMEGEWGERLVSLGLNVEAIAADGVRQALAYRQQRKKLSIPDSFALALAKERRWILLSGDADLRDLAAQETVECHGVLWLIDRMEESGVPGLHLLHDGLQALAGHPRCRLPRHEIRTRLDKYRALIGNT